MKHSCASFEEHLDPQSIKDNRVCSQFAAGASRQGWGSLRLLLWGSISLSISSALSSAGVVSLSLPSSGSRSTQPCQSSVWEPGMGQGLHCCWDCCFVVDRSLLRRNAAAPRSKYQRRSCACVAPATVSHFCLSFCLGLQEALSRILSLCQLPVLTQSQSIVLHCWGIPTSTTCSLCVFC